MSGPKGGGYSVESAAETARRTLQVARGRLELALEDRRRLRTESLALNVELGDEVQPIAAAAEPSVANLSAAGVDRLTDRIIVETARLRTEVVDAAARVRTRKVTSAIADSLSSLAGSSGGALKVVKPKERSRKTPRRSSPPSDSTPTVSYDQAVVAAAAAAADVLPLLNEAERDRLQKAIEGFAAVEGPKIGELLTEFTILARGLAATARARADRAEKLCGLVRRLAGLRGPDVEAARAGIADAAEDERVSLDDLNRAVTAAERAAARLEDRSFAGSALAAAFADMGYEVEEGFETLLVRDGVAHVRHADWGDTHAIRFRLADGEAQMQFHAVRHGSASQLTSDVDRRVEESWCADVEPLLERLRERGLTMRIQRRLAPGERPMVSVPDSEAFPFRRRRSKAPAAAARQRSRPT